MSSGSTHTNLPIIVVGAGIVGASIAHHLARAGHAVLVVDQDAPATGTTCASFAWVGLSKSAASAYRAPLRKHALAEFNRMLDQLDEPVGLRSFGALSWEANDDETQMFITDHVSVGHDMRALSPGEVFALEPNLRAVPAVSAYALNDAGVDPVALTNALLNSAQRHGAEFTPHTPVISLISERDQVCGVMTEAGPILGSSVIVAAGTHSPAIAATAGVEVDLEPAPCCLITFATSTPLLNGVLSTPEVEIRQLDRTTLLAAEDVPEGFTGHPNELVPPVISAIRSSLREAPDLRLIRAVIADRPMPRGGEPFVGPAREAPGLYLAIAHPAIILSGAIGKQVAADYAALTSNQNQ